MRCYACNQRNEIFRGTPPVKLCGYFVSYIIYRPITLLNSIFRSLKHQIMCCCMLHCQNSFRVLQLLQLASLLFCSKVSNPYSVTYLNRTPILGHVWLDVAPSKKYKKACDVKRWDHLL